MIFTSILMSVATNTAYWRHTDRVETSPMCLAMWIYQFKFHLVLVFPLGISATSVVVSRNSNTQMSPIPLWTVDVKLPTLGGDAKSEPGEQMESGRGAESPLPFLVPYVFIVGISPHFPQTQKGRATWPALKFRRWCLAFPGGPHQTHLFGPLHRVKN